MNAPAEKLPTFVLKAPTDFWWEVRIPIPTDGEYKFARLDVCFLAMSQPELDKLRGTGLAEGEKVLSDDELARKVVRGWRDMRDENGNPVPFSQEALTQLLAAPLVRAAIVATFLAASSGMAARKNG